jgi:hypothetical protein
MALECAGNVTLLTEYVSKMKTFEQDYCNFRINCIEKLSIEAAVHETVRQQLSSTPEDATAATAAPATAFAASGAVCIPPEDCELASRAHRNVGCTPNNILVDPARDHCLPAAPHAVTLRPVVEVANAVLQLGDFEKNNAPALSSSNPDFPSSIWNPIRCSR